MTREEQVLQFAIDRMYEIWQTEFAGKNHGNNANFLNGSLRFANAYKHLQNQLNTLQLIRTTTVECRICGAKQ